ncbi:hypothetical protein RclHR1_02560009 [Rhizophagus clarus]|uniref:Uncharacterized protein n=1 Tax=Rhizophagus clarus TaxID=94130 RepID=A0A2Z6RD54_9GLOM|nr:hypothetical protein RclHR1_02560009 [Rhizophagus clarus]
MQDGIVEEIADYTILMLYKMRIMHSQWYHLKQFHIAVSSHQICNEIEEIFEDHDSIISDSFEEEINEPDMLISQLPKGDLNAYEYIHIDEILEGGLTDEEIIDTMLNAGRKMKM